MWKQKNRRRMVPSNCALCGIKKPWFILEKEASGTIGSLAKPLNEIPYVDPTLF